MLDGSPLVTVTDGVVTLRPWSRDDAWFLARAQADPAIRRYNGGHDRLGNPAPPPSITDAEATIDQFGVAWRAFAATGIPSGVVFAIADATSGELVGCCQECTDGCDVPRFANDVTLLHRHAALK